MSKFKHAALALAAAGLMSAQAQAGEAQVQSLPAMPVAAFSQSDINAMFEQANMPMEVAALSAAEMKETEGAWWPVYAARMGFGGLSSGVRYGVSNWGTPQYSAWGHVRAVGYGAVGGLFGWNSWSSATLGAAAGAAGQRWGW